MSLKDDISIERQGFTMVRLETQNYLIFREFVPGPNGTESLGIEDRLDMNQNGTIDEGEPQILVRGHAPDGQTFPVDDRVSVAVRGDSGEKQTYSLKDYMKATKGINIFPRAMDSTITMPGSEMKGNLYLVYPSEIQHPFLE